MQLINFSGVTLNTRNSLTKACKLMVYVAEGGVG